MCSILMNSVLCFDDCALLRRRVSAQTTITGHQEGGIWSGVFREGTEMRNRSSVKDLFWEGTHWISCEDCGTYTRERWSQTPPRRPRHIWRGSVCFDSAHWVSKLCDNFQVPGAWTFITTPLHQSWTPWVRSLSSCYFHIPTSSWSRGIVIFMLPAFI